jgi:hypothetical protein
MAFPLTRLRAPNAATTVDGLAMQLAQHRIVLVVSPGRWSLRWWPSSLAREPNLAYDAGNRPVSVFTS